MLISYWSLKINITFLDLCFYGRSLRRDKTLILWSCSSPIEAFRRFTATIDIMMVSVICWIVRWILIILSFISFVVVLFVMVLSFDPDFEFGLCNLFGGGVIFLLNFFNPLISPTTATLFGCKIYIYSWS